MQVILVKSVRKLGKVGETVSVADGFGRNFLIPQGHAIRATKENLEKFSAIKKDLESKNAENKKDAEAAAKAIKGKHIDFITQSAADGRLYGSVTAKVLATEISKLAKIELNYSNVLLDSPIKFNGVYEVQVMLHPEVTTSVLVVIAKTEPEAQDALREFKEGGAKKEENAKEAEMKALEKQARAEESATIEAENAEAAE
jgi:large subunit ribosomal protein L9